MPVIIATGKDLKRKSSFINRYGQIQEGSIYQNLGGNAVGGTSVSNRLAKEPGDNQKEEKE